jgi:hypothetical protein
MQNHVVLEKYECDGLDEYIKWKKAQIKRNHGNLRGYRIDFECESKRRAFELIKEMKDKESKSQRTISWRSTENTIDHFN